MAKHSLDVAPILADAKDRAIRTGIQNVGVDIMAASGTALYSALEAGGDPFTAPFWIVLGISVGKTALLIAASYLMRLRKEPASTSQEG
jgi:hypothetical protein